MAVGPVSSSDGSVNKEEKAGSHVGFINIVHETVLLMDAIEQYYHRETTIKLDKLLKDVASQRTEDGRGRFKYIHLYCDTLTLENYPGSRILSFGDLCYSGLRYIHVFARRFLADGAVTLDFQGVSSFKLRVFFGSSQSQIRSVLREGSDPVDIVLSSPLGGTEKVSSLASHIKSVGLELQIKAGGSSVTELPSVPFTDIDPPVSRPRAGTAFHSGPS
jgi:hypothetical protein